MHQARGVAFALVGALLGPGCKAKAPPAPEPAQPAPRPQPPPDPTAPEPQVFVSHEPRGHVSALDLPLVFRTPIPIARAVVQVRYITVTPDGLGRHVDQEFDWDAASAGGPFEDGKTYTLHVTFSDPVSWIGYAFPKKVVYVDGSVWTRPANARKPIIPG